MTAKLATPIFLWNGMLCIHTVLRDVYSEIADDLVNGTGIIKLDIGNLCLFVYRMESIGIVEFYVMDYTDALDIPRDGLPVQYKKLYTLRLRGEYDMETPVIVTYHVTTEKCFVREMDPKTGQITKIERIPGTITCDVIDDETGEVLYMGTDLFAMLVVLHERDCVVKGVIYDD